MKHLSVAFLACTVALASAQSEDGGPKKHTPRTVKTSDAPVTQSEARTTFARAESIMRKSFGMASGTPAVSIPAGAKPVTRAQVIAEFTRLYNVLRPEIKVTPSPTSYEAKYLRLSDAKQKANLMKLIQIGAVAKIGPVATGPKDSLTVPQFGDAVGFFMSRMAYMTHMPSAKWTPGLKKN